MSSTVSQARNALEYFDRAQRNHDTARHGPTFQVFERLLEPDRQQVRELILAITEHRLSEARGLLEACGIKPDEVAR